MNSFDNLNYIDAISWKNCKVGQWDLSYDSITSDIALSEWFKKSTEFRAEIERSEPLINPLEILPKENNEEAIDERDDEDVSIERSTLIMKDVDNRGLPIGNKSVGDRIVYDEADDQMAELLISDEVRKNEVEKSGISEDKIKSSEVGDGQVQKVEVEESEVGESEVEESEVSESEVGESEVGESEVGKSEVEKIKVEKSGVEN